MPWRMFAGGVVGWAVALVLAFTLLDESQVVESSALAAGLTLAGLAAGAIVDIRRAG